MITASHPFGPPPRLFSLDADAEITPAGDDEVSRQEAKAQEARLNWARKRAVRFAERASFANEHRLKARQLAKELERRWNERKAER